MHFSWEPVSFAPESRGAFTIPRRCLTKEKKITRLLEQWGSNHRSREHAHYRNGCGFFGGSLLFLLGLRLTTREGRGEGKVRCPNNDNARLVGKKGGGNQNSLTLGWMARWGEIAVAREKETRRMARAWKLAGRRTGGRDEDNGSDHRGERVRSLVRQPSVRRLPLNPLLDGERRSSGGLEREREGARGWRPRNVRSGRSSQPE